MAASELALGVDFLNRYVGAPPPGCRLEVVEHEHDLGVYATICLCWDIGTLADDEWNYVSDCGRALSTFDHAVDWSALRGVLISDEDADEDLDEQDLEQE